MGFSFGAFNHSCHVIQIVVNISILYKFILEAAVLIIMIKYDVYVTSLLFATNSSYIIIFIAIEVLYNSALFMK